MMNPAYDQVIAADDESRLGSLYDDGPAPRHDTPECRKRFLGLLGP